MGSSKFNRKSVSILHPRVIRPDDVDFSKLSGEDFLRIMESTGAKFSWVTAASGAFEVSVSGAFTTKQQGSTNRIYTRLVLKDADHDELEHADLSASACVSLAYRLLVHAVAQAELNNEPQVIADRLTELLEYFMAPARFQQFANALAIAAEERISAKLAVQHALQDGHGAG